MKEIVEVLKKILIGGRDLTNMMNKIEFRSSIVQLFLKDRLGDI